MAKIRRLTELMNQSETENEETHRLMLTDVLNHGTAIAKMQSDGKLIRITPAEAKK